MSNCMPRMKECKRSEAVDYGSEIEFENFANECENNSI